MEERRGFTLLEVVVVLVILGIAAALAAPRMEGMIAHLRTRAAANRLATDLAYTRAVAAREGGRARLVVEPSGDCPRPVPGAGGHRYRIVVDASSRVAKEVDLRELGGRICLTTNRSADVAFDARGLVAPPNNRTYVVRDRTYPADTLSISVVGRVLRRL